MIPAVLQVIAAIIIVVLLFVITMVQYQREKLAAMREVGKTKREVVIFDGIKDYASDKGEVYNTMDKNNLAYKELPNSVNQDSGSEYTYNFWMYLDQDALTGRQNGGSDTSVLGVYTTDSRNETVDAGLSDTNIADGSRHLAPLVLFMRGDPNVYTYKSSCNKNILIKNDVMVKNPIVKLEHGGDVLAVEFTTVDVPDAHQSCPDSSGTWENANAHKVGVKGIIGKDELNKKWFMVTVVLQETDPTRMLSSRNKTTCKIFINGVRKATQTVSGGLLTSPVRQPTGNLYFNYPLVKTISGTSKPFSIDLSSSAANMGTIVDDSGSTSKNNRLMMANLTYYNYAADEAEITSMFNRGFSKKAADPYNKQTIDVTYGTSGASGAMGGSDVSKPFKSSMMSIGDT